MEHQGTISYWLKNDEQETQILSTPITKVPEIGEVIPINTKMDEVWFKANFSEEAYEKFYEEGVSGSFLVTAVKRYIKSIPLVHEEEIPDHSGTVETTQIIKMPSLMIMETFEVFVEEYRTE